MLARETQISKMIVSTVFYNWAIQAQIPSFELSVSSRKVLSNLVDATIKVYLAKLSAVFPDL